MADNSWNGDERRAHHDELVADVLTKVSSKLLYGLLGVIFSIIALISSGTTAFYSVKADVAVVKSEIGTIIKSVDQASRDRYYGRQAERDLALRDKEIQFLHKNLDSLGKRLNENQKRDDLTLQRLRELENAFERTWRDKKKVGLIVL